MQIPRRALEAIFVGSFLAVFNFAAQGQDILWEVGKNDNSWLDNGATPISAGGDTAIFRQERGGVNPLPGDPFASDNDYYNAGQYDTIIFGDYPPVGAVAANEDEAERAFVPGDTQWRVHFNLPADLKPTNALSLQFDFLNIDTGDASRPANDPRWGVEVYFNGVKVQDEILIRPPSIGVTFKTKTFTLEDVNAQVGPGFDNIVTLQGNSYSGAGGGDWLGIDYLQLNKEAGIAPDPVFPFQIGKDDNTHAVGDGGGENTTFVRESGSSNALPGNPANLEQDGQADDDYYLAGSYTTTIPSVVTLYGDYTPVGIVSKNEEAAERALVPSDPELRYHFNFPNTIKPTDRMSVVFEPNDIDTTPAAGSRQYGVEIYVNGVKVMDERVITDADVHTAISTPPFTVASVNGGLGSGPDNIITLKGIAKTGGGDWMGIDYVKVISVAAPPPPPTLTWTVGVNDNRHITSGNGGGAQASFVQEDGTVSPLPGTPFSPEVDKQADNDYYLAGVYNTVITGNGTYTPFGIVSLNEEAAERALTTGDTIERYHFNLPATVQPTDKFTVIFDALDLDDTAADAKMGVEIYVNNVKVLNETLITRENLGQPIVVPAFTAGSVNIQPGEGADNIVTLKGISKSTEGGGDWMGIDWVQFSPVVPPTFGWTVGRDDNAHPVGNGGEANATFVQEAGSNTLPGSPTSPERDQQNDDDYYLAGVYTTALPENIAAYGDYTPVGEVLVNEEAAERAFAGTDNTKRYHFNIPATMTGSDQLVLSYDFLSIDQGDPQRDPPVVNPRYGVEVYVNDVKLQDEILVVPADVTSGRDFIVGPFTLDQVHAKVGPGFDNIITLKGVNYNSATDEFGNPDPGGNWLGIDYIQLDPLPTPTLPIQIGQDDNTHLRTSTGGGPNANFMQENGSVNELPGNPKNVAVDRTGDNDYYMAGVYTTTIPAGVYEPVGIVTRNEESAERAFTIAENEYRYHFNLPATLKSTDKLQVTFDVNNFDDRPEVTDPQWSVSVEFNGVTVMDETLIKLVDLDKDFASREFTLQEVGAQAGPGFDNIVTLRGTNHSAEGGGDWMGIDYVKIGTPGGPAPQLQMPTLSNNRITLNWTGTGTLESAPTVLGPWTPVSPAPQPPYSEDIQSNQNRFYRLVQ